jgi:hypothetical protein
MGRGLCTLGFALSLLTVGVAVALPQEGANLPAPVVVPKEGFLSTLKQAFKEDFDHEVVRGHFEAGSAPDMHRYYCLVDAKTGRREPKGVSGELVTRSDGMTGIKGGAVGLFACDTAEQQGILITNGYVLKGPAAAANASPSAAPSVPAVPAVPAAPMPPPTRAEVHAPIDSAAATLDVAGLRLGMSVNEVRGVLKAKDLLDSFESREFLGRPSAARRFVNVIVARTADEESYAVMFTPVPGRERAMAIVHATHYGRGADIDERALARELVKKYGGSAGSETLPSSPMWRVQKDGQVSVSDSCTRRQAIGALDAERSWLDRTPNLALETTPDEFLTQIDHCGVAILTEDHSSSPDGTRLTVIAYSPSIAFDGATTAAQLMQSAESPTAVHAKPTPNL